MTTYRNVTTPTQRALLTRYCPPTHTHIPCCRRKTAYDSHETDKSPSPTKRLAKNKNIAQPIWPQEPDYQTDWRQSARRQNYHTQSFMGLGNIVVPLILYATHQHALYGHGYSEKF